jgi:hypothetical protein
MRRVWLLGFAGILLSAAMSHPTRAAEVVIGVNSFGANVKDMAANGVKTMRISLFPNSVDFVIDAYRHGISSVVIVYPYAGSSVKWKGAWGAAPLSKLDPKEFTAGFSPMLEKLEAAGVRLAAIELGSEINTSGYNGDIPVPGSKRVLGLTDLNNPHDTEAAAIAAGYRQYLKIMAALKELRDRSKLNQRTPLLSAGLVGVAVKAQSWNAGLAVSLLDSIAFWRQNGLDQLVDGYGLHVYPDADAHRSAAVRIASMEQTLFAPCTRAKPCWLTEWGIGNGDQACPAQETQRRQVIGVLRSAFKHFVDEGRLHALIYYAWVGVPGKRIDSWAIWRCGGLTEAGKLALSPM